MANIFGWCNIGQNETVEKMVAPRSSLVLLTLLHSRFQDTEVFSSCWDLTGCGCEGQPWLKGEEVGGEGEI